VSGLSLSYSGQIILRWRKGQFYAGSPIDVVIDNTGSWYLLFNRGIVVLLDSEGGFLNVMDWEDGIPPSSRRLLLHPATGDLFVGSGREGLVVVAPDSQH